jgi:hypothetical protein
MVYVENGLPCSPLIDQSIPVTFENNEFSSRQWIEELDEKKDAEPMEYWPAAPLYELNDASASEWVNRDPGLDMVPMHSPEPSSTGRKKITPSDFQNRFLGGDDRIPADPALDNNWVQVSGGRPKETKSLSQVTGEEKQHTPVKERHSVPYASNDGAWVSPAQPVRREPRATAPEPQMADPMWGSEQAIDATWGSPDPFAPTSISHFDMMSPEERKSDMKPLRDAFDPFGEEDDGFMQGTNGKLFAEPPGAFAAIEAFAPALAFGSAQRHQAPAMDDGFDTFYPPGGLPLKPVSRDMDDRTEI